MKLWEVANGFMGNGYVRVLIIAETKKRAQELATEKFKENIAAGASPDDVTCSIPNRYPPSYWKNLDTELLTDDTSIEYAGDVSD